MYQMYQVLVLGTGMAMGTMVCTLEYLSIEVQVMGMGTRYLVLECTQAILVCQILTCKIFYMSKFAQLHWYTCW
jgi:hypothetical protein